MFGMRLGLGLGSGASASPTYTAETQAYATRVIAGGGSIADIDAIDQLVKFLKGKLVGGSQLSESAWSKICTILTHKGGISTTTRSDVVYVTKWWNLKSISDDELRDYVQTSDALQPTISGGRISFNAKALDAQSGELANSQNKTEIASVLVKEAPFGLGAFYSMSINSSNEISRVWVSDWPSSPYQTRVAGRRTDTDSFITTKGTINATQNKELVTSRINYSTAKGYIWHNNNVSLSDTVGSNSIPFAGGATATDNSPSQAAMIGNDTNNKGIIDCLIIINAAISDADLVKINTYVMALCGVA
jgi:hypothetical protein